VEFTKKILAQDRVRLIGVCFGHQIIGRALEQKVGRSDRGWEVSVTPMELTAKGKELFGVKELVSQNLTAIAMADQTTDMSIKLGHPPNAPRRRLHPSTLY
jgi:GMP synthase-like glutamine amidotransferase